MQRHLSVLVFSLTIAGLRAQTTGCPPISGVGGPAPTDVGNSTCAINDTWLPVFGIDVRASAPAILADGALGGRSAIAVGVAATDTDYYVLDCVSNGHTTALPITWCSKLGYVWSSLWTPTLPVGATARFLQPGIGAANIYEIAGDLIRGQIYSLELRCVVVDLSAQNCGAGDASRAVAFHFSVEVDACGRNQITYLNQSGDLPVSAGPPTQTTGNCCVAGSSVLAGPPIVFQNILLTDCTGGNANVVTTGEAILFDSNWNDFDYLRRTCDDNNFVGCPKPRGGMVRRLLCEDVPSIEFRLSRTAGQGSLGFLRPGGGPPSTVWVAPVTPGRFTVCPIAHNSNCGAFDSDVSPGGIAVRAVPLQVRTLAPKATAWADYAVTGASPAADTLACATIPLPINDNDSDQDGIMDLDDTSVAATAAGRSGDLDLAGIAVDTDADLEIQFVSRATGVLRLWRDESKLSPMPLDVWLPVGALGGSAAPGALAFVEASDATAGEPVEMLLRTAPNNTQGDYGFLRHLFVHFRAEGIGQVAFVVPAGGYPPTAPADPGAACGYPLPWSGVQSEWRPDGLRNLDAAALQDHFYIEPDPILGLDDAQEATHNGHTGLLTWMQNHRDVVKVRARVVPARAGVTVWFRSYDVDDITHDARSVMDDDSVPSGALVPVSDNGGVYDNYGPDAAEPALAAAYSPFPEGPDGVLMTTHDPLTGIDPTHPSAISAVTDANGDAFVYLCVSTTPGDNYRVVASLDHDLLGADGVLAPGPTNWSPGADDEVDQRAAMAKVAYKMTPAMLDPVALPTTLAGRQASFAVASVDLMVRRVFQLAFRRAQSIAPTNRNSSDIADDQDGFGVRRKLAEFYPVLTADGHQVIKLVFDSVPAADGTGDNKLPQYWYLEGAQIPDIPEERDTSVHYADNLVVEQPGATLPTIVGNLGQLADQGGWMDGHLHVIQVAQLQAEAFHILGNGETTAIAESGPLVNTSVPLTIPALGVAGSATSMRKQPGRLLIGGVTPTPDASWVGKTLTVGTVAYAITAVAPAQQEVTVNAVAANLPVYVVDRCWRYLEAVGITHMGGQLPAWSIDRVVTVNQQSGPFLDRMFRNLPMVVRRLPEVATGFTVPFIAHLPSLDAWPLWQSLLAADTGYDLVNRPRSWCAMTYSGYDGTMLGDESPAGEQRDFGLMEAESEEWPADSLAVSIDLAPAYEWLRLSPPDRAAYMLPWNQLGYTGPNSIKEYELRQLRWVAQSINQELMFADGNGNLPAAPIAGYNTTSVATIPGLTSRTNLVDPGLVDPKPVQHGQYLFPSQTVQGVMVPLQETGLSPYSIWFVRHHLRSPGVLR